MQLSEAPVLALESARAGLGKSTLACALALSLEQRGVRVGLIDADLDCPDLTHWMEQQSTIPLFSLSRWRSQAGLERVRGELWEQRLLERLEQGFDWPEVDLVLIDLAPGALDPREAQLFEIDARLCLSAEGERSPPGTWSVPRLAPHPAWRQAGTALARTYPGWDPEKPPRAAVEALADELLERLENPDWRSER